MMSDLRVVKTLKYSVNRQNMTTMKQSIITLTFLAASLQLAANSCTGADTAVLEEVFADSSYQLTGVAVTANRRVFANYSYWLDNSTSPVPRSSRCHGLMTIVTSHNTLIAYSGLNYKLSKCLNDESNYHK
jgi:hypothetical protein